MADEKRNASADEKDKAPDDPRYSRERLVEEAHDFLGVPSHVAAGALADGPREMSVKDAKSAVKEWLKREVQG